MAFGVLGEERGKSGWKVEIWVENAVCSFQPSFGTGDCRRDQHLLQTRTLPVTYTKVRDKAVGAWDGVWGPGGGGEGVGQGK